jgi:hypothetical protein
VLPIFKAKVRKPFVRLIFFGRTIAMTLQMSRDWRVDGLRGYFLILMTLTHLPEQPLERFTHYTFGFASAPDGFVFLSGLVSAWVYLRVREKHGQAAMEARVLRRTRDIYLVHILLLTLSILSAVALKQTSFEADHPIRAFFAGALFLYQPRLCDILPMYCIFLVCTPVVLDQIMKGRAWFVGLISVLLWLVSQRGYGDGNHTVPWIFLGAFNILAWQAYFVAGQYLGARKFVGQETVPKSRILLAVCILLAIFFFVDRHLHFITGLTPPLKVLTSVGRNPERFLNAACLGYIVWRLPRTLDHWLMTLRLFKFMNLLGRHSLQVFMFSLLVTVPWLETGLSYWTGLPESGKVTLALTTVLSLAIPAWLHEKYQTLGRSTALAAAGAAVAPRESVSV